ncbi:GUN4 domain-containing protein [Microcoleus sp. FACHB-831]|uniref:serine/threonine-protein kinase n=1 Tax=Microcoleus sp. FACHB-831 TaxID=2692827 RepID=UPI0016895C74|nr:serine/threonine-protein kinase [Microcoleus sp. FACHB-831]MBD1921320.1 GUN4 domain-containing protein [Microcoleus sp. FACHB-831]
MSHWAPRQQLKGGKYIVEELLGFGGFGVTYRAREQPSGQFVAIKTLNALQQSKPDFAAIQENFVNEAMCLASCRHVHIVKVLPQLFQQDGLWCMVMEYIEGQDLASYLDERGVLSEQEALRIIRQVGDALTFIHNQGFLHRDVKPLNIMLRRGSLDAVLIDFGLAREFISGKEQSHTNYITERFAPIEQYQRRAERGAYTDVYALAATLYNLLTYQLPPAADIRKEFSIPLVPPKQHNPKISDRVNDAIIKGMALEPKDRPQSVQEWLALFTEAEADDLSSERGIDYRNLRDLLKAGKWKEADEETYRVMLKAARRESEGWLDVDSINSFPCKDLRTIDQLWVKYSNGRFGFSVQKRIWESVGGNHNADCAYEKFGDRVGWRVEGNWISCQYYRLTLYDAPFGHLPSFWEVVGWEYLRKQRRFSLMKFFVRANKSLDFLLSRRDL